MEKEKRDVRKKSVLRRIETWTVEQKLYLFSFLLILLTLFAAKNLFFSSESTNYHTYTVTEKQNHTTLHVHTNDIIHVNLSTNQTQILQSTVLPTAVLQTTMPFENKNNIYSGSFVAANPGTATITVTERPKCQAGHLCPMVILQIFSVRIAVTE